MQFIRKTTCFIALYYGRISDTSIQQNCPHIFFLLISGKGLAIPSRYPYHVSRYKGKIREVRKGCKAFEPGKEEVMPSEETRRLLKIFGIAVTDFEDAVDKGAPPEEVSRTEAEVRTRLDEVTALIERLRAKKP